MYNVWWPYILTLYLEKLNNRKEYPDFPELGICILRLHWVNKKNLPRFQMGHTCYSLCNEYCTEKIHLFNNFKVCIIGIVYIHIMTGMMANNHLFLLSLFLTVEFHAYNYYLRVNKANQCMDLYISCYKDYISKVISVLTWSLLIWSNQKCFEKYS